ncbi:MAG: DMT family transporter [Cellulosilyticaceae bacterium]
MYNLYAAIIGIFIALMIGINGILSEQVGTYSSTVMIHLIGFIAIIGIVLIKKVKISFNRSIPLYLYLGGAIGVFTVLFNVTSFSAIGASLTMALGLLGESIASTIIDHYGLFGTKITHFNPKKIWGLLLIILGIAVMAFF